MRSIAVVLLVAAGFSALTTAAIAKDKSRKKGAGKALKEATGFKALKTALKSERPVKERYRAAGGKFVEALNYQAAGVTFSQGCVKFGGKFKCAAFSSLKHVSQFRLARNEIADGVTPGEVLCEKAGGRVHAVADIQQSRVNLCWFDKDGSYIDSAGLFTFWGRYQRNVIAGKVLSPGQLAAMHKEEAAAPAVPAASARPAAPAVAQPASAVAVAPAAKPAAVPATVPAAVPAQAPASGELTTVPPAGFWPRIQGGKVRVKGNNEILTDAQNRTIAINRYAPDGTLVETVTGPLAGDFWEYQIEYPSSRTKGLQIERRRLAKVEGGARVVIELTKYPPDEKTGLTKNHEKRWDVAKAAYTERQWDSLGNVAVGKSAPECPPPLEKLEAEFPVGSQLMRVPSAQRPAQWPALLVALAQSELELGNTSFVQQLAQRELATLAPTAPERARFHELATRASALARSPAATAEEQAAAATIAQALVLAQKGDKAQFVAHSMSTSARSSWQWIQQRHAMPSGTGGQERLAGRSWAYLGHLVNRHMAPELEQVVRIYPDGCK